MKPARPPFYVLAGLFGAACGAAGLAGCAFGIDGLRNFGLGRILMKANGGVCLILAGSALALSGRFGRIGGVASRALAAGAFAVSAATFLEYLLGADFGIDQLLFPEPPGIVGGLLPGRMAWTTALNFAALSLAVILAGRRRPSAALPSLAFGTVLVSLASIAGLLYGVAGRGPLSVVSRMAVPTALSFLALSAGLISAAPPEGLAALWKSDEHRALIFRRMSPLMFLLPLALGWLKLAGENAGLFGNQEILDLLMVAVGGSFVAMLYVYAVAPDRAKAALGTLSRCNEVMMRAQSEQDLLDGVCRAVIAGGAYRMVWVGYKEHDERKSVRPVASAGQESGYLRVAALSWDETQASGNGPTGRAIREGRSQIVRDIGKDPLMSPWRAEAAKRGYAASASLPLTVEGRVVGAVMVYAAAPGAFDDEEVRLLEDLAADLSFGLSALQARAYNRTLIEASPDPLVTIGADGRITDVNRATESATGRSRGALIGSDFCDYFTDPARARQGYQQVFDKGFVRDYPLEIIGPQGRRTSVLYNATVYRDAHGQVAGVFAAARDVTLLKKAQEELSRVSAYNRGLIETSPDPLVTIGTDGRITDVNRATEAITGCLRAELIGSDFADYFTEPDRARAGYEQVFRQGAVRDYALEIRHRDGRRVPVLYNATVYEDQAGRVAGVFAAARDITERKRAEDEIRHLNADLERRVVLRTEALVRANKELEAFAYSVSHDLRAPLRAADGFSQILVEEHGPKLEAEARRYLGLVRDSVRQMGRLIDDLLSFSRLSRQALAPEECAMQSLAREAWDSLEPYRRGRQVEFRLGSVAPCRGDAALVRQVWTNLLSNALKFTRGRSPAVIEAGSAVENGETVYCVKDNGVGFDMRYADKLFKVFQRLHKAEEFEGTGVGLAIVARVAERHGGRAWASGEPGKGAEFRFTMGGESHGEENGGAVAGRGRPEGRRVDSAQPAQA